MIPGLPHVMTVPSRPILISGVSSTSQKVLGSNPKRAWASFVNLGTGTVYLGFGMDAAGAGVALPNNGTFMIDLHAPWCGEVWAVGVPTGVASLSIQEVSFV